MEYVNLGGTGLRVSRVCLGMMSFGEHESRAWAVDESQAEPIVKRAVEGGVIFFDTADVYNGGESEVVTGRVLRRLFGMREEYVVATKVRGRTMPGENGGGLSRKHVLASIDASLERLQLDYVDLYQIHRWDSATPIEETMEVLHDVVKAGKARYIGASSMFAWQFAKAQHVAGDAPFVSMQNHYNLIYREEEREMIPQCLDMRVGLLPWSPLARGNLAGARPARARRRVPEPIPFASRSTGRSSASRSSSASRGCRRARRSAGADRARVAAAQAGGHGADRRSDEGRARRGRTRGGDVVAERRRDQPAGGAVRLASDLGHRDLNRRGGASAPASKKLAHSTKERIQPSTSERSRPKVN